jgi:hypothetical protein
MRDGATLFTAIYTPKDLTKNTYHNATLHTAVRCMEQTEFKRALVPMKR